MLVVSSWSCSGRQSVASVEHCPPLPLSVHSLHHTSISAKLCLPGASCFPRPAWFPLIPGPGSGLPTDERTPASALAEPCSQIFLHVSYPPLAAARISAGKATPEAAAEPSPSISWRRTPTLRHRSVARPGRPYSRALPASPWRVASAICPSSVSGRQSPCGWLWLSPSSPLACRAPSSTSDLVVPNCPAAQSC